MKILLVTLHYAPERSGTAPYTAAWARHLAGSHDVEVIAGLPHYPEWQVHEGFGAWRSDTTEDGVRIRRLRHHVPSSTSLVGRLGHELSFAARVLSQPGIERPDIVLAVSPALFGAVGAARLAVRFGVPFGLVVQDIYGEAYKELGHRPGRGQALLGSIEQRLLTSASGVLTIHDRFRQTVESFGVDAARVSTVGNWAQVPVASRGRDEVRRELGWGTDEFVVLHAGNMGVKQGLENVVAAALIAHSERPDVRFVLLGDGNQRRLLAERARNVPNLTFLPSADDASYPNVLAAADALLINQRAGVAEMSLPSKLTSYCAAGRPIITAVDPGSTTAEAVRATGAGILVPSGLPRRILGAVDELRNDPGRMAGMGASGAEFARRHRSFSSAMVGYDGWLDRVRDTGPPDEVHAPRLPPAAALSTQ